MPGRGIEELLASTITSDSEAEVVAAALLALASRAMFWSRPVIERVATNDAEEKIRKFASG